MKFGTVALVAALVARTQGFAPVGPARRALVGSPAVLDARTSTSLDLFGSNWLKARMFNAPAKGGDDITEKEVRALFELWNDALATGDSRIVASRYTKVRLLRRTACGSGHCSLDLGRLLTVDGSLGCCA